MPGVLRRKTCLVTRRPRLSDARRPPHLHGSVATGGNGAQPALAPVADAPRLRSRTDRHVVASRPAPSASAMAAGASKAGPGAPPFCRYRSSSSRRYLPSDTIPSPTTAAITAKNANTAPAHRAVVLAVDNAGCGGAGVSFAGSIVARGEDSPSCPRRDELTTPSAVAPARRPACGAR